MAERVRIIVFILALFVIALLTFSLSKSFSFLGSGYEVSVKEQKEEREDREQSIEPTDEIDLENGNGRVLWKQFFFYPVGLVTETGGLGPDGIISHARNLFSVNLRTGSVKRIFTRDAYIWDFFIGEFTRHNPLNNIDEPKEESLLIERRVLVFAAIFDTNKDGVLNQKDAKRLYLYDPDKEELLDILPLDYIFKDLVYDTGKNLLVTIVRKLEERKFLDNKPKKKPEFVELAPQIFSYDVLLGKGVLTEPF